MQIDRKLTLKNKSMHYYLAQSQFAEEISINLQPKHQVNLLKKKNKKLK